METHDPAEGAAMPTDVLVRAKKFRESTEKLTRARQIEWFREKLGVDQTRVLCLLGYSPAQIKQRMAGGASFRELAEAAEPEKAVWVSELFRGLIDRTGYDLSTLAGDLKRPRPRTADQKVLHHIRLGGPEVLDHLATYLSPESAPASRTKGTRKAKNTRPVK